ncbi:MAG TPA: DNA glycosylase, partial [Candidatus Synoicihabitans sp.]|nr:DNA glycosylase [Candidatus Synoicihabitans sp.]
MWTDWRALEPRLTLSPVVLAELLDGGQAFRWWRQPDDSWMGQWRQEIAQLRCGRHRVIEWRAPVTLAPQVATSLPHYLNLHRQHHQALDRLPWRSDPHLARCVQQFPGLRLLRQPFGETLLGFLCSATKQIVQIKQ